MRLDGASRYLRLLRNPRRELIDGAAHIAALGEEHSPYHASSTSDDLCRVDAAAVWPSKLPRNTRSTGRLLLTVE